MGVSNTRLGRIYNQMKQRCYNPRKNNYARYGGRGISVCDEWLSDNGSHKGFNSFKSWALSNGYSEELTLDRIDNRKGYSPANCRWVTYREQANNRRNNRFLSYKGKTQSMSDWCRELSLNYDRVRKRIANNWTVERAFETK